MLQSAVQRRRRTAAAIFSTALLIVGTSAFLSRPDPSLAADVNVVTVVAADFAFTLRDTLPAGRTEFRLVNKGPALHHVAIIRIADGKTMADLAAAIRPDSPELPAWAVEVGGPNAAMPGSEANATLTLEPGRHVMLCFIPADDGKLHMMKGMMKEFTVVPASRVASRGPRAPERRPDAVLTLRDYQFDLSKPIAAGTRTVRVRNAGVQAHEVLIARLSPGATAQQLLAAMEKPSGGPPRGVAVGGTTGLAKGQENDVTVNFTKGDYALICFVPDARDGKPHVAHGMIRQIRVE